MRGFSQRRGLPKWRRGFTGPTDFRNGYRCYSGSDHLLFWDYTGDKVVPNIAKGYATHSAERPAALSPNGSLAPW